MDDAGLARAIGLGGHRVERGDRGDVDNAAPAAPDHVPAERLVRDQCAGEVDPQDPLPLFDRQVLGRDDVLEYCRRHDQRGNRPGLAPDPLRRVFGRRLVGDVERHGRAAGLAGHAPCGLAVDIRDGDPPAARVHEAADRFADAVAAADNRRDRPASVLTHRLSPASSASWLSLRESRHCPAKGPVLIWPHRNSAAAHP